MNKHIHLHKHTHTHTCTLTKKTKLPILFQASHSSLNESKEADDNDGSSEDEDSVSDDEIRKVHTPLNGYDEIDMPDEMKKKDKIPRTPPQSSHGSNGDEATSMAWTPRRYVCELFWYCYV